VSGIQVWAADPGRVLISEATHRLAAVAAQLNWLGEVDSGSNAWVISGARTASGLPLVAGDSHRALDTPGVYYQIHIACPTFRVSGYAVPGVPGAPHFSHTEYVAWGMTHGYGDYQDLFIERFRTQAGRLEYAYQDAWLPAEVSHAKLLVRGAAPEEFEVVATHHGSIIAGQPRTGTGLASMSGPVRSPSRLCHRREIPRPATP
jgi:penicillin amidase